MTTLLVIAAIAYAVLLPLFFGAWFKYRAARRAAQACDFPGCAAARRELEALAIRHANTGVPSRAVLDVIEGVRRHERRRIA